MQVHNATPKLVSAVSDLIASDMADALTREGTDLGDETAIAMTLHAAGFGAVSIAALIGRARELARRGPAR